MESDVSAHILSKAIAQLDVDTINVYINSYGGEVAESWAIYHALSRHRATINTFADGFAASAALNVFMAGDNRYMYQEGSLLMAHNTWIHAKGNAEELRKQADNLDIVSEGSNAIYSAKINISDEDLQQILDNETWISPQKALEWGFATAIIAPVAMDVEHISQSVQNDIFRAVTEKTVSKQMPPAHKDRREEQEVKPEQKQEKKFFNFGRTKND